MPDNNQTPNSTPSQDAASQKVQNHLNETVNQIKTGTAISSSNSPGSAGPPRSLPLSTAKPALSAEEKKKNIYPFEQNKSSPSPVPNLDRSPPPESRMATAKITENPKPISPHPATVIENQRLPTQIPPAEGNRPPQETEIKNPKDEIEEILKQIKQQREGLAPAKTIEVANPTGTETSPLAPNSVEAINVPKAPQFPGQKSGKQMFFLGGGLLILFLIAIFFLISRSFKKVKEQTQAITLNYWGLWEPEPVMQGVIAQWEKENPKVKIKYKTHSKINYGQRLKSALSKGNEPDIFRFHNTWLPMIKTLAAPVPQEITNDLKLKEDYYSVVSRDLENNGSFYGLPLMIDTLALFYNKDLLQNKGFSPPKTWWALRDFAKKLTEKDANGKIQIAGVALGTTTNVDHWSDILGLMILQNGADPLKPNSQAMADALAFYSVFSREDGVWDATLPSSTALFAGNRLAFYFAPSWRIFNIQEANPELNFGVTVVPQLPKATTADWQAAEKGEVELTNINWASYWAEGVSSKSQYQKEAWQFLEFLSKNLQTLYQTQGQIRAFGEIYPQKILAQTIADNPLLNPFILQAENAYSWYLASATEDEGINARMIEYYGQAIDAINKGNLPETTLQGLEEGVNQVSDQYQLTK